MIELGPSLGPSDVTYMSPRSAIPPTKAGWEKGTHLRVPWNRWASFFFVIFLPFSLLMFTVPLSSAPASLDFLALFFQLPQAYT